MIKFEANFSSKLRHYIEFLTESTSKTGSWDITCSTYAEIKSITETNTKDFDDISFGHLLSEEYFIITCRFIQNIHRKMRIKFGERYFAIKRIINLYELNHIVKIIALEITEE